MLLYIDLNVCKFSFTIIKNRDTILKIRLGTPKSLGPGLCLSLDKSYWEYGVYDRKREVGRKREQEQQCLEVLLVKRQRRHIMRAGNKCDTPSSSAYINIISLALKFRRGPRGLPRQQWELNVTSTSSIVPTPSKPSQSPLIKCTLIILDARRSEVLN